MDRENVIFKFFILTSNSKSYLECYLLNITQNLLFTVNVFFHSHAKWSQMDPERESERKGRI